MAIEITKHNFDEIVLQSHEPVLVDFWADWCGPCRMLAPVIADIEEGASGYKVAKINIDEQPELAEQFGVMSIPTLVLFKNGNEENRMVGAASKERILSELGLQ